jgi:hypothetical protein
MRLLPLDIRPSMAGLDILEASITEDTATIAAILAANDGPDEAISIMATMMSCAVILLGELPADDQAAFLRSARAFFSRSDL